MNFSHLLVLGSLLVACCLGFGCEPEEMAPAVSDTGTVTPGESAPGPATNAWNTQDPAEPTESHVTVAPGERAVTVEQLPSAAATAPYTERERGDSPAMDAGASSPEM